MVDITQDGQPAGESKAVALPAKKKKPSTEGMAMIAMMERVALDPAADIEKLKAIMQMKKDLFMQQEEIAFNEAMARVQNKMRPVAKKADNLQTKSKYAKMEALLEMITPIYSSEGFALSFDTDVYPVPEHAAKGWFRIVCDVTRGGFERRRHVDLPPDIAGIQGNVNKTGLHGYKSTLSYGKGMLICMIFNIALKSDDDDGNSGGGYSEKKKVRSVSEVYPPDQQTGQTQGSAQPSVSKAAQTHVNASQIKLLRTKMASAGKSEVDLLKRFEIKKIEDLRFPKDLNGAMEWVTE